ncbi:6-phosphogluconolactonase 1 [Euphorbia peplus]|nr:6-phosphogluconolactonase 1 [Euphorbia peplus]
MPYTKIVTGRGEVRVFEDHNDLAYHLAEYIDQLSDKFYKEKKFYCIALSDDELVGLLGKLCEPPYTRTVDWNRWYMFWADERLVPQLYEFRNYKKARDQFLSKIPVPLGHRKFINGLITAKEAAEAYEHMIKEFVQAQAVKTSSTGDYPMFDLILLGMGSDGQVASLFPNHPKCDPTTTEWVTYFFDSPEFPLERVTFTLPVINAAANVAIVVTGEDKAEAAQLAIEGAAPDSDSPQLPARMVQPAEGKLVWFLDHEAASKLHCYKPPHYSNDDTIQFNPNNLVRRY